MVTLAAFRIDGIKMWFWSNDHEPPHFHAKRTGEWEVKVNFLSDESEMIVVEWAEKKPSRKILKAISSQAAENRAALFAEWRSIRESEA